MSLKPIIPPGLYQSSSGGGTIPSTTNLLSGDGAGNAANSGIAPANVALLAAANVFTRLQTITQGTANEGILASTGYSLTGSDATSMVNLAGTWNTTGTPSAIKLNITDTASNSASKLADFQVGGSSKVAIHKNGSIVTSGSGSAGNDYIQSGANTAIYTFGVLTRSDGAFAWSNGSGFTGTLDTFIKRGGAAASVQLGNDHATAATNQTIKAHNVTTGTGAALFLQGGTGSVAGGAVHLRSSTGTARVLVDDTGLGFYGTAPIAQQTGVAVDAAAIHAALVNLGLITA